METGADTLEKLLYAKYLEAINRQEEVNFLARKNALQKVCLLKDRQPIHSHINKKGSWIRNMYWPKMGLLTHHDPKTKKSILKKLSIIYKGKNINKLINQKNLDYYNKNISGMQYNDN